MSDRTLPREYRTTGGQAALVAGVVVIAAAAALFPLWTEEDMPASVRWIGSIAVLALFAWLVAGAARSSTTADLRGIRVRGVMRVRRMSWREIQDIRVEANPGASMQQGAPRVFTYAYGANGKRTQLIHLDGNTVDLEGELAFLHAAWVELRGADWTESARVTRRIDRGEARRMAVMGGLTWGMTAFFPLIVLSLLPLFGDVSEPLATLLSPGVLFGVGCPAAWIIGSVVTYRRLV
ncbi:PH domain-containing protein [Streptomyces sp. NPDC086080]|uniref:PH domain-containing protein n=1 Tax=Streptomyces sp. NPDC086080 TaxID=3365748 RepID=UPI0037CD1DB5